MTGKLSAKWPTVKTEALGRCHPPPKSCGAPAASPVRVPLFLPRSDAALGFEAGPGWALGPRQGL